MSIFSVAEDSVLHYPNDLSALKKVAQDLQGENARLRKHLSWIRDVYLQYRSGPLDEKGLAKLVGDVLIEGDYITRT